MENNYILNLEEQEFHGDVLDIGFENKGIIYNIYKKGNDTNSIDYVEGNKNLQIPKKDFDTCVLLFCLHSVYFNNKRKLLQGILDKLKDNGIIYIWDIHKPKYRPFFGNIEIVTEGRKKKCIKIKEVNIVDDNSYSNILELVSKNYDIIETKNGKGIFYIKAVKRKCVIDEGKREAAFSGS